MLLRYVWSTPRRRILGCTILFVAFAAVAVANAVFEANDANTTQAAAPGNGGSAGNASDGATRASAPAVAALSDDPASQRRAFAASLESQYQASAMDGFSIATSGDGDRVLVWHHDAATSRSLAGGYADGAMRPGGILELATLRRLGFVRLDIVGPDGQRWNFPVAHPAAALPAGNHDALAGSVFVCRGGVILRFHAHGRFDYQDADGRVEQGRYGVEGFTVNTRIDGVGGVSARFVERPPEAGLYALDPDGTAFNFCAATPDQ